MNARPLFKRDRPFKVRGFKAIVMPRAKDIELLSSLHQDYVDGLIDEHKMSLALRLAGHPYSASEPRRIARLEIRRL